MRREGPSPRASCCSCWRASSPSEEARLTAVFAGRIPARYAQDRVSAEGGSPTLEQLARQLPPGFEDAKVAASQALALTTAFGLAWPVPENTRVASPFGYRIHPTLGYRKLHTGVDLSVPQGTEVHVVEEGVVRRASEDAVNGRVLIIDHGRGVSTAYCHNSELLVKVGQRVKRGELIAHSGNTGRSTGPHLHYQLELASQPVDPLRFRGGSPWRLARAPDVSVPRADMSSRRADTSMSSPACTAPLREPCVRSGHPVC